MLGESRQHERMISHPHRLEGAMFTRRVRAFLVTVGLAVVAAALLVRAQDEFDFAIAPMFLEQLDTGRTILPSFRIHIDARSDIKDIGQDCEVHLAGTVIGQAFGDPEHVVVFNPTALYDFLRVPA